MYEVEFYEDKEGYSDVREYISELQREASKSKESRINYSKIIACIDELEEKGTRVGMPITRHLQGEIWELRPLKNRILFVCYIDNKFVLLNHFIKKTRKTPRKEIVKAKRRLQDFLERKCKNDNMDRI